MSAVQRAKTFQMEGRAGEKALTLGQPYDI